MDRNCSGFFIRSIWTIRSMPDFIISRISELSSSTILHSLGEGHHRMRPISRQTGRRPLYRRLLSERFAFESRTGKMGEPAARPCGQVGMPGYKWEIPRWQNGFYTSSGEGVMDGDDFLIWQNQFPARGGAGGGSGAMLRIAKPTRSMGSQHVSVRTAWPCICQIVSGGKDQV